MDCEGDRQKTSHQQVWGRLCGEADEETCVDRCLNGSKVDQETMQ